MQTTIILTRDNASVPWGFRLKGGSEYNVSLSILKVNEDSPAYGKLDVGDVLVNIGKFSALNLRHEEALHLIRMFDNSLPLVINRQSFNVPTFNKQPVASSAVWRPPSQSSQHIPVQYTPQAYTPQPFSPKTPPQYNNYSNQHQQQAQQNYNTDFQSDRKQSFSSYPTSLLVQASPVPVAAPPPPPPPPLPTNFSQPGNYIQNQNSFNKEPAYNTGLSSGHQRSLSSSSPHQGGVPDTLAKVMNSPGGRKPFTYTPGGLDLSHIRQSARVKRYESDHEDESFSYKERQREDNYSSFQNQKQQHQQYQPVQAPSQQYKKPVYQPSNNTPYQNIIPKANQKPAQGFVVAPEDLQRSREDKKDSFMNQSFSFRMLNKWIEESESSNLLKSKKDEELESQKQEGQTKQVIKSEVAKAIEEEEKRSVNIQHQQPLPPQPQPQQQYYQSIKSNTHASTTVPSKAFQMLERRYSIESDVSDSSLLRNKLHDDEYNGPKVPARERDQENEVPRYKGAHIPSKTFKMLQHITHEDETRIGDNIQHTSTNTVTIKQRVSKNSNSALSSSSENLSSKQQSRSGTVDVQNSSVSSNSYKKVEYSEITNVQNQDQVALSNDVSSSQVNDQLENNSNIKRRVTLTVTNNIISNRSSDIDKHKKLIKSNTVDHTTTTTTTNHNNTNSSIDRTSYARNLRSLSVFETSDNIKINRRISNDNIIPSKTFRYLQRLMSIAVDSIVEAAAQEDNPIKSEEVEAVETGESTVAVSEIVDESKVDVNTEPQNNTEHEQVEQDVEISEF